MVADDLDRTLIGAYRTVGAQTPEFAALGPLRRGVNDFGFRQRIMMHIIHNTYRKAMFRFFLMQILNDRIHVRRRQFLGTQAIPAAYNNRAQAVLVERIANIKIQRFAQAARFLGPIQYSDFLYRFRNHGKEMFD